MITLKIYNDSYKSEWDNFIDISKNSTFLFKRDFMDYHSDKFKDNSLLIYKNSKLVALFPLNITDGKVYSHQGLTYGGMIVKHDIKFIKYLELFTSVLNYLHDLSIDKLFIKQIPVIYNSNFNGELDYLSFISGGVIYRRDIISVIDMQNDFKISKDRIQGYKRGLKNNLEIREVDNFDDFWNSLLIPTLSKKYSVKPVHNLDEIKQLKDSFRENIKQFNVYHKDKIVAGTTIFQTKNVVHVQYIGSTTEKNFLGSLDFLFYKLIKEIYVDHRYFDFGNSHENEGMKINQGLNYWKEGFGARSVTQDFYEIETSNFKKLKNILI
tara:strand:- start:649 stop:1620 length:972 start_codon:yes stop_codon:yes gene_type:complete